MGEVDALPESPEAITADWLTRALADAGAYRGGNGPRARAVEVVDAHSGTTGRARIRVTWEAAAGLPSALFVKLPPTDPTSRAMVLETGMGRREARFYRRLAGEVPVRTPAAHLSAWNEDGSRYVMLLEDLADAGCRFPGAGESEPDLLAIARSLVRGLARLHAAYWDTPRWQADLDWVEPPMHNDWGRILVQAGLEQFRHEMPAHFAALAELYLEDGAGFERVLEAGPRTLIHGDSHLGNLFVQHGEVGWLDWACFSHGPGMRDVAYFLTNSLPTAFRRQHERALLAVYGEALAEAGGPAPAPDDLWHDYRRFAAYSWVAAVTTAAAGSRMQPIEVGRRAMARMNEAVADLATLELYREQLA